MKKKHTVCFCDNGKSENLVSASIIPRNTMVVLALNLLRLTMLENDYPKLWN